MNFKPLVISFFYFSFSLQAHPAHRIPIAKIITIIPVASYGFNILERAHGDSKKINRIVQKDYKNLKKYLRDLHK